MRKGNTLRRVTEKDRVKARKQALRKERRAARRALKSGTATPNVVQIAGQKYAVTPSALQLVDTKADAQVYIPTEVVLDGVAYRRVSYFRKFIVVIDRSQMWISEWREISSCSK